MLQRTDCAARAPRIAVLILAELTGIGACFSLGLFFFLDLFSTQNLWQSEESLTAVKIRPLTTGQWSF